MSAVDCCPGCGERTFLMPLHGDKGGPLCCPLCVGQWNAEHGRRRRTGRIVIRAMMAFFDAGGRSKDIDKLKESAQFGDGLFGLSVAELSDPLGYMSGIARMDGADVELLTSELLADVLRLTHPDHHPPEREDLARRVTQQLLALQPFVFPAPKPKRPIFPPTSGQSAPRREPIKEGASRSRYPMRRLCRHDAVLLLRRLPSRMGKARAGKGRAETGEAAGAVCAPREDVDATMRQERRESSGAKTIGGRG